MQRLLVVIVLALAAACLAFGQAQTAQPPKPGPEVQKLGSTLALVLPLALFAAPSQQEWPRKGDKVFVAATFEGMAGILRLPSGDISTPLTPCAELKIVNAKPDKPRWTVEFVSRWQLEGPWLPRMHNNENNCIVQINALGEPNVKRSGDTFTILPASPK